MAFYRCNLGGGINLGGTPDKKYSNNTAGSSGTVDISVSQKPRYIICSIWTRTGSAYYGKQMVIDVNKMQGYQLGIISSGNTDQAITSSVISQHFPTISASKVTYNYAAWGANHRVYIQMYY